MLYAKFWVSNSDKDVQGNRCLMQSIERCNRGVKYKQKKVQINMAATSRPIYKPFHSHTVKLRRRLVIYDVRKNLIRFTKLKKNLLLLKLKLGDFSGKNNIIDGSWISSYVGTYIIVVVFA